MKEFIQRLLEQRKATKASGRVRVMMDDERRVEQLRQYQRSGSTGSWDKKILH